MNATSALGWALVHFLWQGAALALLLAVALTVLWPTAARTRDALSLLTLVAMLVLPISTGLRLFTRAADASPVAAAQPTNIPDQVAATSPAPSIAGMTRPVPHSATIVTQRATSRLRDMLDPAVPWLVVLWVIGVVVLSIRLAHGWIMARRLRTNGTRDTSVALQQVLARFAQRLRVTRPVRR